MKKAFTLAEVLVSLMIIGIIATLTIPVIQNSSRKQEYTAGVKKAYNILQQAHEMAQVNNGESKNFPTTDADTEKTFSYYRQYLNISKYCFGSQGCWTKGAIKNLNKATATGFYDGLGYGTPQTSFKMPDGSNWTFDISPGSAMIWIVDVNGDNGPNIIGRDIFFFNDYLDGNGIVPNGNGINSNGDCTAAGAGLSCASRVLREDGMNY